VRPVVFEIQLFKNWVFFARSEKHLFTSLILLNIVKNTPATRKVIGNELEGYTGPDITCQKNSGSLEGSNKSKKPPFVRSKIMGIN
jgi:hypothetical protein